MLPFFFCTLTFYLYLHYVQSYCMIFFLATVLAVADLYSLQQSLSCFLIFPFQFSGVAFRFRLGFFFFLTGVTNFALCSGSPMCICAGVAYNCFPVCHVQHLLDNFPQYYLHLHTHLSLVHMHCNVQAYLELKCRQDL